MQGTKQFFLFITLILWATLIGAITYSHMVYFPPYLSHLPESTALVTGPYGLHEENFWKMIHPVLILSILITVIVNWQNAARRKYILGAILIYALAIAATFIYFVPELMAFADSSHSSVMPAEWLQRGQRWQYLSWTRGAFIYFGFILLLIGLTKNTVPNHPGLVEAKPLK